VVNLFVERHSLVRLFFMFEKCELSAAVKFCFLLGKTAGEAIVMPEIAYNKAATANTQVYDLFSRFRDGELSLADQPRSGRPSTSRKDENTVRIRELILEDRRRTIDEFVDLSGVSYSPANEVLARNCK
jgi:hypothetical protein